MKRTLQRGLADAIAVTFLVMAGATAMNFADYFGAKRAAEKKAEAPTQVTSSGLPVTSSGLPVTSGATPK